MECGSNPYLNPTCTGAANADSDPGSQCPYPNWLSCDNQYTLRGSDGFCDGLGFCDVNDVSSFVAVGDVCRAGASIDPDGNTNCGTGTRACFCANNRYQCDLFGDCTYDPYYVGFNLGATCIATGQVERAANVVNPTTYPATYKCSVAGIK